MSAAHWLVPPPPALMGMRAAPGVPARGHALDPRACPACGTATATPAPSTAPKPQRARRVVPVPSTDVTAPTPHAEWRDRVMPGFADRTDDYCDRVQGVGAYAATSPAPAPTPPAPQPTGRLDTDVADADLQDRVREFLRRVPHSLAGAACGVSPVMLQRIVRGARVRVDLIETTRRALLEPLTIPGAVESLTEIELDALRERVRRLGHAVVAEGAGVSPVVINRALAGLRPGSANITRVREYLRAAPVLAVGTVRAKLVVAAYDLATSRGDALLPFDDADLVVRAWELFPESFSMRGYAHPDSNRVLAKLPGTDGLVGRGYLRRVSTSTYALTPRGVAHARTLAPRRAA